MIECTSFTSYTKGITQGFCDFYIEKWGLHIYGCSLAMKNGHKWINFPARQYTDKEGNVKYMSYIRFKEKGFKDKFDKIAIEAIEKFCKEKNIDLNEQKEVMQQMNYLNGREEVPF